jgi:transcriptional antiterminator RfaH
MPDSVHWLLAYTKPRAEKLAEEHLLRQGFEVFAPTFTAQKRRRGRWEWVEEPLFPRYVFVGAHAEQSWSPVQNTVGVTALVRFGGQVATVPGSLVEQLKAAGVAGPDRQYRFTAGQTVRIVGEQFSSIEGIFQMQDGEQRAQVLVHMLGRPTVVKVALADVLPEGS